MFESYKYQILETGIVIILFLFIQVLARKAVRRVLVRLSLSVTRSKMVIKSVNFITLLIAFLTLAGIWGIHPNQLFFFISSLLTILGIGFFAQWSILSNITSGLILFFNHPIRIGDHIQILDKDYPVSGTVEDIAYFFMHIKTDDGKKITIPNSIALQKTLSVEHRNKKEQVIKNLKKK